MVTLQSKLFASFVALVMVPLSAAALLGAPKIVRELEERTRAQLQPALVASKLVYDKQVTEDRQTVQAIAAESQARNLLQEQRYPELQALLQQRLGRGTATLDYLVVATPDGTVLTHSRAILRWVKDQR